LIAMFLMCSMKCARRGFFFTSTSSKCLSRCAMRCLKNNH
jgi:hypothetical protein